MTSSAPCLSTSSSARGECASDRAAPAARRRSWRFAGASRSAVIFSVLSITFGERPGSTVETTPTLRMRYGATRMSGAFAAASARVARGRATANGMIFTVAIISPATTGL